MSEQSELEQVLLDKAKEAHEKTAEAQARVRELEAQLGNALAPGGDLAPREQLDLVKSALYALRRRCLGLQVDRYLGKPKEWPPHRILAYVREGEGIPAHVPNPLATVCAGLEDAIKRNAELQMALLDVTECCTLKAAEKVAREAFDKA